MNVISKTDMSVQGRLYRQLETGAERPALAFCDSHGEYTWQTYQEVHSRAVACAAQLAKNGLGRGDICILVLPSSEYCASMILGTFYLGAVPLLVAPPVFQGPHSNLQQILNRVTRKTKARLVVGSESMALMEEKLQTRHRSPRFLCGDRPPPISLFDPPPPGMPGEDDIAAMQLTSGTTGFPRICVWRHKQVLAALDGMEAVMKLGKQDTCFNWTPLYHDMGLVNNFLLCLTTGVPLAMLNPRDFVKKPALWLQGLSRTHSTLTWSPNFGYALAAQRVKDDEIERVRLDGVRAFWNAAERIHLDTIVAFRERFLPVGLRPEALKTNFGCAENVGGATFSDVEGMFVVEHVDPVALQKRRIAQPVTGADNGARVVSVVGAGKPCPGMRVIILSRTGQPLPDGHVGEVALDTPSRMAFYLGDARKTRRAFCGQLLRTGDLGYLRGNELFWVGRVSERIAVRGKKFDPSDFEPILLNIADVRPGCFAAFGVDDEKQGTQRIVIVTEVRDGISGQYQKLAGEIREKSLLRLGTPIDDVILVRPGTLTKTSSGKRRHRHFRKLYLEGALTSCRLS